jgi:hypothetical protein
MDSRQQFPAFAALKDKQRKGFVQALGFIFFYKAPSENIIRSNRNRNGFLSRVRKTRRANVSSSWRKRRFVLQLS